MIATMPSDLSWPTLLGALLDGKDLAVNEAAWAMREVMNGAASSAQLAGFLVALRAKGETVDEVLGFRDAILANALPLAVDPMALDIVGTGGDRFGTVNISTMASVVAAAAGVPVIKHGNRAASSASGSSDVLAALGLNLDLDPQAVARVFGEAGITFAFAALFHPGFRHAAQTRRDLGIPTVFNFLGPLVNPARCQANAVGVANLATVPLVVGVLRTRGASGLVFRGEDGLDELTTTGHSHIWEISGGSVTEHDLDPVKLGIPRAEMADLRGGDAAQNAGVMRAILAGQTGAVRDIVLLNCAAGLVAFDLAQDAAQLQQGIFDRFKAKIAVAAEAIDSGAATLKLNEWVEASNATGR